MKQGYLILLLTAASATAQVEDPTRPPPESMTLPVLGPGSAAVSTEGKGPRLESVLVGRNFEGREIAVIDGKVVRRGEKFNGAVLVRVTANTAVLKRGSREEVLRLFPPVIEGKSAATRR